mmetsp:Transcript_37954/g.95399  ORF Transcript_37954/g.95399 Transcript_37954/m.95399 type:complete len:86 (+) Transcript_37954:853-1110(+)
MFLEWVAVAVLPVTLESTHGLQTPSWVPITAAALTAAVLTVAAGCCGTYTCAPHSSGSHTRLTTAHSYSSDSQLLQLSDSTAAAL